MQEGGPPKLVYQPGRGRPRGTGGLQRNGVCQLRSDGRRFRGYTGLTTYELTFDTPGEYPYYCALHGSPTMGMRAKVTVT